MSGTRELPNNTDASAAEQAIARTEDEAVAAQAHAVLALAYEQRTLALIEAAQLRYARPGKQAGADALFNEALERLTTD